MKITAGVDEVGRGCLAGPVISAAVILKKSINLKLLKDSKKIPFKKRLKISEHIKLNSYYSIGIASVEEILNFNILRASLLSMRRALDRLTIKPELVLIDGNFAPKGLKNFKGVQRRFNKIFTYNEVDFFDDYAHHPTEIKVVLDGVKNVYNNYEKICIFQPHRISRLKDLKKEFTYAFKDADKVILFPIYTAGEKIKLGFSYLNFAKELIKNSKIELFLVDDKYQLAKYIKSNIYGKKIVIGMGAGTISGWMRELPKFL